jgi:hypothetical protein
MVAEESQGRRRCPLFCDRSLLLSVNVFLSALMYKAVVLCHGDDYWLVRLLRG